MAKEKLTCQKKEKRAVTFIKQLSKNSKGAEEIYYLLPQLLCIKYFYLDKTIRCPDTNFPCFTVMINILESLIPLTSSV